MKTLKLKPWYLLLCFTMLICSVACSKSDDSNSDESAYINTQIFNEINAHRKSLDKKAFASSTLANTMADEHSAYMAAQGKLSYDDSIKRAGELIAQENAKSMTESVANKYSSAETLIEALLNDAAHRKNIEDDFTHIGIGVNKDANGVAYYSLIFFKK
ncbi:CAP domain-containing protein [Tamlana sp. I1]|uniref:CAP domain-containing protein n=1 Tax=Tamlana sp. I1 TaxID=2762061 RepID=UPI00188F778D|nr:CAP domain-containing protein [Tamlana sp. I1]